MADMKRALPGFVMDMYYKRADYDARMSYGKSIRKLAGAGGGS